MLNLLFLNLKFISSLGNPDHTESKVPNIYGSRDTNIHSNIPKSENKPFVIHELEKINENSTYESQSITKPITLKDDSENVFSGSSVLRRTGKISDRKLFFESSTIKKETSNRKSPIEKHLDTTSSFAKAAAFWNKL